MAGQTAQLTLRFLVRGSVQGVGFRYFVLRRAASLGLYGWTRNLADGSVEVVARGEPTALASLEISLLDGPRLARVTDVEKSPISDDLVVPKSFEIR
ncbi:MAG TPA: acylphosphatase [Gemmatimonadales bacterium]|jgi:acylphosphatase